MTYITRANFQSHPFHLVSPSPWPLYTSSTLFATTLSGVLTFHSFTGALRVLYTSLISVVYSMCLWFRDVINEATYLGNHTLAVQIGINLGVGLFIISEALFFLAIFWSFFHSALLPTVELGAKWPPFLDFVISFISLLLYTVILMLILGIIVVYSKNENTTYSGIHNPLVFQVINLSRLLLKTIIIFYTFDFVLILWCTSSIGVEGIICLGFIFYMALELLVNIISIISRLLLIMLICLILGLFIFFPSYFIIYLVTTLCVIYYTFFDVKKNGFIYNIYHENTLYEKNLYGNLTALGLFIYLVFTIFRVYLLVQDPYVFVNGRSSNDFFATVLNSSGGGGGGNPSPNNPPDYSIIGSFDTTNNDPENNLSAITNNNKTSSVSSAPNLIEDPSNNTKKRKAHDMASSFFNLTGSSIPKVSAPSGSIISTSTNNIPSLRNDSFSFTWPVASTNSANIAPSAITSAPYSAEKASEVIATKSFIDLSAAFKQSSANINYVHRHHPRELCCITLLNYDRFSLGKSKELLEVFLRDSLEQCEIIRLDFRGGRGINPKHSTSVFSLVLNDQAFHYTVDNEKGVCIPDIRRNGDQFGKVYPKKVEIKGVRFLFFPDAGPAKQKGQLLIKD